MLSVFQSFTTLVNNALRVAAINSVGDFILFLGKIGVMAATGAVGILWFKVSNFVYVLNDALLFWRLFCFEGHKDPKKKIILFYLI